MSFGSELVSEYFPDAPEKCLECPGLVAAAGQLSTWAALSSESVDVSLERGAMEDEEAAAIANVVGSAITHISIRSRQESSLIAKGLYESCEEGSVVQNSTEEVIVRGTVLNGLAKVKVVTQAKNSYVGCGSSSPVAAFIGADSTYREVWSTPVKK